jgi:hypothetical protein
MRFSKRKLKMFWRRDIEPYLNAIATGLFLITLMLLVFSAAARLLDRKTLRDVSKFMNSYETERQMAEF